ncbi:hypothetical protein WJX72_003841 [[Myrmecia] bisecta]|uniref:J domain-containing protein n=1 Tax=[Myrmecia] bisecta TaxID=41462 RepID=A0AAW1PXM7_9CHLO
MLQLGAEPKDTISIGVCLSQATAAHIKHAFRKKAKQLHPDVHQSTDGSGGLSFAQLLAAYQVLSDARERELYDLSRNQRASRAVRDAAAGGPYARDSSDPDGWMPGEGFWAWTRQTDGVPHNQVDRLRAELKSEVRAALRHAYLGPRLEVESGQLPEQFEAEERSTAGLGDVLQLVSGRQLLGVVRHLQADRLQDLRQASRFASQAPQWALPHQAHMYSQDRGSNGRIMPCSTSSAAPVQAAAGAAAELGQQLARTLPQQNSAAQTVAQGTLLRKAPHRAQCPADQM